MKAIWNNRTIAESDKTIIIEGNHYFPSESVKKEFLKESEHTSECVWKGTAHYFHIQVEEKINQNVNENYLRDYLNNSSEWKKIYSDNISIVYIKK